MIPAQEGFNRHNLIGFDIDDWLVGDPEFAGIHRAAQGRLLLTLIRTATINALVIDRVDTPTARLGAIERPVRRAEKGLRRGKLWRGSGDPDGPIDVELVAIDEEWRAQRTN